MADRRDKKNNRQTQSRVIIARMFRLSSIVTILCFFLWILPLGAFIKPSQEDTACGGKRAFHMCMCSMGMGKIRPSESTQKISFANASDFGHQGKSSAGASGDDFLLDIVNRDQKSLASKHFLTAFHRTSQTYPRPVFHPPTAFSL
jgi:hypothetical protein